MQCSYMLTGFCPIQLNVFAKIGDANWILSNSIAIRCPHFAKRRRSNCINSNEPRRNRHFHPNLMEKIHLAPLSAVATPPDDAAGGYCQSALRPKWREFHFVFLRIDCRERRRFPNVIFTSVEKVRMLNRQSVDTLFCRHAVNLFYFESR